MGRHTDPRTLQLLAQLKEKGVSLGYATKDEYPMLGGLYVADLVWQLAKDQPPLVTFELETRDSLRVFKNISKYFDTISADIPKPFRHFLIVVKGELSNGTRKPLQHYIDRYNVSLFEDVDGNEQNRKLLFRQLDELKIDVTDLVRRYLSSGKIDETLQGVIRGIQEGMPDVLGKPKEVRLSFGEETRRDPLRPFQIKLSTETPSGKPTIFQRIHDALKTGQTIRLTNEDRIRAQIPGLGEHEIDFLEIKPESVRGTVASLETPNYEHAVELLLTKVDEAGGFTITNSIQDAPWKIAFVCDEEGRTREVQIEMNFREADPYQVVYFVDFLEHAKRENKVILRRQDGLVLFEGPFAGDFPKLPESYLLILRALADVQNATQIRFPVPEKISREELHVLSRLQQITSKGFEKGELRSFSITLTREEAKRRLYLANNPDVIENLRVDLGDQTLTLLGKTIPLGRARTILPEARIDLRKLDEGLKSTREPITVNVSTDATQTVTAVYEKWSKQQPEKGG
jgi:hypothetical protein